MRAAKLALLLGAFALGSTAACTQGTLMQARVSGLQSEVARAEQNGAMRCAPRELALAKAHTEFANIDLAQGQMSHAEAHLALAEPNVRAALMLSPADRCTTTNFVEIITPKPGDKDGDGILDPVDKCPLEPESYNGIEDTDGCPDDADTDADGIFDSVDQCILEPEDKDGYLDQDGCPDLDNDGDGILDPVDKCPLEPEDFDGFKDDDGCLDADNDGDSVADLDDFCPNTPGMLGGNRPGCPKKMTAVVITAREIRITQQIQFITGSAVISPPPAASFKILDEVAEVLKDNPKIQIEVQGHTDNVGPAGYNQVLSDQRAASVKAYLIKKGIDPKRLSSKGYGMTRPLLPNTTAENRTLNRRVQFIRGDSDPMPTPP